MIFKKISSCLKVIITCNSSFEITDYWLYQKLNSIKDLKIYADEFPNEEVDQKTIVLNCFSNSLDINKALENFTITYLSFTDCEKGVYHDKSCDFSIYFETRTSYVNDSI